MRKTLGAVVAVTSALVIAGCSSSSSSSGGGGTSSSSSSGGGASGSGVAAAKAYEAQFLNAPANIGITTPLSKKPAAGKLLVGMDSGLGSAKVPAWGAQRFSPSTVRRPPRISAGRTRT